MVIFQKKTHHPTHVTKRYKKQIPGVTISSLYHGLMAPYYSQSFGSGAPSTFNHDVSRALMVQKSQTTTWDVQNPANQRITYQPQLVRAQFLNHQQQFVDLTEVFSCKNTTPKCPPPMPRFPPIKVRPY